MPDRTVDPERPRGANAFDTAEGLSGQGYRREREEAEGARGRGRPGAPAPTDSRDIPPDNGRRASFDPRTGEVHGSGVGAGGGQAGEDFDTASASGGSYPVTGGEGDDSTSGDLGPAPASHRPG